MSTDQPEGVEPSRPGRAPRVGDSRSPVGSTLSIILAVVAVVAGFLILRTLNDDDDGGASDLPGDGTDQSTPGPGSIDPIGSGPTTSGAGTTTTTPPQRSGATIAVANASGEGGTASAMSTALVTAQYQGVGDPGNGTGTDIEQSIVYYVEGDAQAQAVARTLAQDLGVGAPQVMPAERPVDGDGDTSTATVLVLLGSAQAGEPLAGSSASAPTVAGGATTSSAG